MKTAQEMVLYLYQFYTLKEIADMAELSTATIHNAKMGYLMSDYSVNRICSAYIQEYEKRNRPSYLNIQCLTPIIKPVRINKLTARQNELISERLVKETEGISSPDSAYLEKIRLALTDQFQALNGNTDFQDDTRQ